MHEILNNDIREWHTGGATDDAQIISPLTGDRSRSTFSLEDRSRIGKRRKLVRQASSLYVGSIHVQYYYFVGVSLYGIHEKISSPPFPSTGRKPPTPRNPGCSLLSQHYKDTFIYQSVLKVYRNLFKHALLLHARLK